MGDVCSIKLVKYFLAISQTVTAANDFKLNIKMLRASFLVFVK